MTYKLALQLKNAGWKQIVFTCRKDDHFCNVDKEDCIIEPLGFPTLSELIEACGEEFCELVRSNNYTVKPMWLAYPSEEAFNKSGNDCVLDCCGYEIGSTPEEAVANLWLAINKK